MKDIILPQDVYVNSVKETEEFAASFAKSISFKESVLIAFFSQMGAGKTAFVRGFARHFGVEDMVCSPTFNIINEYIVSSCKKIVHCDMYRINGFEQLYDIGYFDILNEPGSIFLVEWGENISEFLPELYIKIEIAILGEQKRKISITKQTKL